MSSKRILGISAFYHDSAAAIVVDGEILAAAQEERFTRKKQDASFPSNAVSYCLEYSGVSLNELDAIVFYDKPLLKFERLLETYYGFAPEGIKSFIKAIPVWLNEKMFFKRLIRKELQSIDDTFDSREMKLLFPEHHLSHAASTFYPSPFEEAAIITVDGVGEWATASFCHGKGKDIEILHELQFPHSVGLLYSAFTYFLGFKVNSGEYKLMGLAPYGNVDSDDVKRYVEQIKSELITIYEDGSLWMNQTYFNYSTGLTMVREKKWEALFGMELRDPESEMKQCHCDLGLAIQIVTEEIIIAMAKHLKKLTGANNLCLAGGVALNCVANGKLINEKIFENVYIQPAAGDAGGALGAALAAQHIYFGEERKVTTPDSMGGAYLGPEFSNLDIELTARKFKAKYDYFEEFEDLAKKTAAHIAEGKAIGWFQGRMEFGPRALGNRSILGDARNKEMQKKLNLKIKYRESFRPFAPSVLNEKCSEYFEFPGDSPYMLIVQPVVESRRQVLPEGYKEFSISDKLYFNRSDIPSITHIDFSARIQTVHENTNYEYWKLITEFEKLTGYGLIVNTSFNVRGEPIVCTPEDAYRCLMRTEMDFLVMGNYFFSKADQPEWLEQDNWREEFVLD